MVTAASGVKGSLPTERSTTASRVRRVRGCHIIGGGEEGDKSRVRTKEEADHSLPYMIAEALLDGQMMPEQYEPERIQRDDVADRGHDRLEQGRDPATRPSQAPGRLPRLGSRADTVRAGRGRAWFASQGAGDRARRPSQLLLRRPADRPAL
jgi:MmgE/PrpD C-terminal domain